MNDDMQKQTSIHIALHLLFLAASITVGVAMGEYRERHVLTATQSYLDAHMANVREIASITDSNGADEFISTVITECARHDEYEALLNNLETLSKNELLTLQSIFKNCSGYYTERKALMVARLKEELEVAQQFHNLRSSLDTNTEMTNALEKWKALVALEEKRSALLDSQNAIQSRIIELLISGSVPSSVSVQTVVQEAQNVSELLQVHNLQIDALRGQL